MEIDKKEILSLKQLICGGTPHRAVIVSHVNPDGDAIGSSLALQELLQQLGHTATCVIPNKYPYFLDWMQGVEQMLVHRTDTSGAVARAITEADLIFFVDFHSTARLEDLGDLIASNTAARRVLIDHHLNPPRADFDVIFSSITSSSTCFLLSQIIEQLCGEAVLTRRMAEALYVGMMTDTGNFSFSYLTADLFRAVARLVEAGIDVPAINNAVYNSYSEGRARLFGYVIDRKMEVLHNGRVACMSLTEAEMRRYNFQPGDSEGFVNYPLTIRTMCLSAMLIAHRKFIRVSLRSRGAVDVDAFARRYFEGGGHHNAAGGKSYRTIEQTIEYFKRSVEEFIKDGGLG